LKNKILLLLFLSVYGTSINAQNGLTKTEKLASFGKIYGFLKYYHPEVAKGKFDWDKEFMKYLPQVLAAQGKESLSRLYLNWIDNLGEIRECKKCDSDENYFDKNFDLSWTQDTAIFTNELSSKLKYIENNRNQGDNYYVSTESSGYVKVTNEPNYEDFEYPAEEYRLLGLFKYWNTIEYFYPYKYLTDQDWDAVLTEMIPKIQNVVNKSDYQSALKELIAKLDDSHAWINFGITPNIKSLPVKISNIENKAVISGFYNDSIATLNNLKLGDVILKINGSDIQLELEKKLKFVSGSNKNDKINKAYNYLFVGTDDTLMLTVERDGDIIDLTTNRYNFGVFNYLKNKKKLKSKALSETIGYINMASTFEQKEIDVIFKAFENKKAIIIDLRHYPQLIYWMFTRHLTSEKREFFKAYWPSIHYPGKFIFKETPKTIASKKAYKGKVIILVSNESLSRSEFTAMAFQTADNAITVGNQTAGTDGENNVIEYMGGYKTAFTGTGILYPDGTESQRKGVKIDMEIKPTINGLRQGRDEVLEKAIEIANE
jgi:C-terminal processing protease CtpA/Prc